MKKTLFIIILIIIPLLNFAQRFDGIIIFGMSASQIDGDLQGGYNKIGANLGLNVAHKLNDKFEFQTGINYIGKGARNGPKEFYYLKTQLHYFQIPVQLNRVFYKRFSLSGGLYFGYLILGRSTEMGSTFEEGDLYLRNFEPSIYLALNYHYFDKVVINFGFSYSVLPLRTQSPAWYNRVLTVTGTYRISNGKK